jgi:hypothetical protein
MPWEPQPQQEAWLRGRIKARWPGQDVETGLGYLKHAKNKAQAYAVVEAVDKYDDLRKLSEAEYVGLTSNNKKVIQEAVSRADGVIAAMQAANAQANARALAQAEQIRLQAEQIRQDNARINMYLPTVTIRAGFNPHRSREGMIPNLPIQDVARQYANAENILPRGGHYIEWYPRTIGGVVSPQKRFFTKRYDQNRLWYTEGGTHGAEAIWWVRDGPNGDWIRFRG